MKQIVDKLNKIAKKIDESVEIPQTDLIIDSLDAITKAYGGTPNDSNLIVDKLEDIYNNIGSAPSGNIEITENGENINVAPFATATVNVSGGGGSDIPTCEVTFIPSSDTSSIGFMQGRAYELVDTYLTFLPDINETTTKKLPYFAYEGEYYAYMFAIQGTSFTPTNEVNCTLQKGGRVVITDPTIPSSITLTGESPK